MTTAQDPPRRRKEKARRAKQLAAWRVKKAAALPMPSDEPSDEKSVTK